VLEPPQSQTGDELSLLFLEGEHSDEEEVGSSSSSKVSTPTKKKAWKQTN
jgi:hypothetical protein